MPPFSRLLRHAGKQWAYSFSSPSPRGADPEWEGQRKEEREESSKPGKVVPTGPAQRVGSGGRAVEQMFGGVGGCHTGGTKVIWGPAHPHQETVEGRTDSRMELVEYSKGAVR